MYSTALDGPELRAARPAVRLEELSCEKQRTESVLMFHPDTLHSLACVTAVARHALPCGLPLVCLPEARARSLLRAHPRGAQTAVETDDARACDRRSLLVLNASHNRMGRDAGVAIAPLASLQAPPHPNTHKHEQAIRRE